MNRKTKEEVYAEIVDFTKRKIKGLEQIKGDKHLYYISAEFLIGKMLKCNLINLNLMKKVEEIVNGYGYTMEDMDEVEPEPALGNGGLGRLAACFLDSIASLDLPGDGIGLYYHFGLFKQKFENHQQVEYPDSWIQDTSWFTKTNTSFRIPFNGEEVTSVMYDMDIVGYHGKKNTLHLFDIDSVDETCINDRIEFDKKQITKNLTLCLYPDDSDEAGRLLRIYQQYFMVSNAAQFIIQDCKNKGFDINHLDRHVCIQINDTHPTLIIPELIRLLMKEDIQMKTAIEIVRKTCSYTNHTILAEALETWPIAYLKKVVPHLMDIIEALDTIVYTYCKEKKVQIIDEQRYVHMAHMDIHYGYSVNGVAALHTDILKKTELNAFYRLYPEKFNNKTNGITFRRWLFSCNPELTLFLRKNIGDRAVESLQFDNLMDDKDNERVIKEFLKVKQIKKEQFVDFIKKTQHIELDANSIFDIQIKRLHEYKRQQMNALYIIYKYLQIKAGHIPLRPITFIFGAKAAPAYTIAKDIIHLLLCLQTLILKDNEVNKYIQICFIENYNVSKAEKVIPACDISEQISLASKEASGTGNMKFMLNGAVTLGTRDGANTEIEALVKEENIYIFGESSDQVIEHYRKQDYCSKAIYEEDDDIQRMLDFIVSEDMIRIGDKEKLTRLYQEIINKDWFMTLLDLHSYIKCKDGAMNDYEDRIEWGRKCLVNIAKSSFFSSDRTILEYNQEIWKLKEE